MGIPRRSPIDWADLHPDLLCEISRRLTLKDYISFLLVCKPWSKAISTSAFSASGQMFIIFDSDDSRCFFYNLSTPSLCSIVELPELAGSICMACRVGWLLLKQKGGEQRVYLFNPFFSKTIQLPPEMKTADIAFFSTPVTSKCTTHILCREDWNYDELPVGSCQVGDEEWEVRPEGFVNVDSEKMKTVRSWSSSAMLNRCKKHQVWERFTGSRPDLRKGFALEICKAMYLEEEGFFRFPCRYSCGFSGGGELEFKRNISKNASLPLVYGVVVDLLCGD